MKTIKSKLLHMYSVHYLLLNRNIQIIWIRIKKLLICSKVIITLWVYTILIKVNFKHFSQKSIELNINV